MPLGSSSKWTRWHLQRIHSKVRHPQSGTNNRNAPRQTRTDIQWMWLVASVPTQLQAPEWGPAQRFSAALLVPVECRRLSNQQEGVWRAMRGDVIQPVRADYAWTALKCEIDRFKLQFQTQSSLQEENHRWQSSSKMMTPPAPGMLLQSWPLTSLERERSGGRVYVHGSKVQHKSLLGMTKPSGHSHRQSSYHTFRPGPTIEHVKFQADLTK